MSNNSDNGKQNLHWFEIPVTDMTQAVRLYGAMLDTKIEVADFGGTPHGVIGDHRSAVSGALVADPKRPPRRGSGTVLYFGPRDGVAPALARAVEAGAKVVQPLTAIPPHGAIALIEDLDGNIVGLHEEPKS